MTRGAKFGSERRLLYFSGGLGPSAQKPAKADFTVLKPAREADESLQKPTLFKRSAFVGSYRLVAMIRPRRWGIDDALTDRTCGAQITFDSFIATPMLPAILSLPNM